MFIGGTWPCPTLGAQSRESSLTVAPAPLRLLLSPLAGNLGFDSYGHSSEIFFAGGAHSVLNFLGDVLGFVFTHFNYDLVMNDVHDLRRGIAQLIFQQAQRAL